MSRIFKYKQMYFKIISFYFLLCFAWEQKNSFKAFFHYISGRILLDVQTLQMFHQDFTYTGIFAQSF